MKFSLNWLKRHLNTTKDKHEIKNCLINLGLECKNFLFEPCWEKVEIVKIIEKTKHENSDSLQIYKIITKSNETLTIVSKDNSIEVGNFVPLAKIGTVLPNNFLIEKRKLRGVESFGMFCSAKEINLPINQENVLQCFEEDFGKTIAQSYESEAIVEIEVTSNRAEALSVRGIARMLCVHSNIGELLELKYQNFTNNACSEIFKINSTNCLGLQAAIINYTPKETSNEIKKLLQLVQIDVKNLDIIDLTNFISHDIGQPMHAFDFSTIENKILTIENIKTQQNFLALNKQTINLEPNTLAICANSQAISWPGIIGGNSSKITKNTTKILIETGIFQIDVLQKRKNNIQTASAKRSEYGLDYNNCEIALNLMLNLLNVQPIATQSFKTQFTKKITYEFDLLEKISSLKIAKSQFEKTMEKQGFVFNQEDNTITPPSWLYFNIFNFHCIVEEFLLNNHMNIKSQLLPVHSPQITSQKNILNEISCLLGFVECKNLNLSIIENQSFFNQSKTIPNANKNYSTLRSTLVYGLLQQLQFNFNHKNNQTKLFETGLIFNAQYQQTHSFMAIATNHNELNLLLAKIFCAYNITNHESKAIANEFIINGANFFFNNILIAKIGLIHEEILNEYNLTEVYALEIFVENLRENFEKNEHQNTSFQPIFQDISFKLNENEHISPLLNFLQLQKKHKILVKEIYPNNLLGQKRNALIQFEFHFKENVEKKEINEIVEKIKKEVLNELKIASI